MGLKNISDRYILEVTEHARAYGDESACEQYNINRESLGRYRRERKKRFGQLERSKLIDQIVSQYTDEELRAIAKSGGGLQNRAHVVSRDGRQVRFGAITDTHIGSSYFGPELLSEAIKTFREEGCEFITHSGDVTEGMSNRPGHIYELTDIGYTAQKSRAIKVLSEWDGPLYLIDGNHDRWFVKSAGAYIVEDIANELPDAVFLGNDEGDLVFGNVTVKLWHGEDSASYATSYRLQKLIESLPGGHKPHVLIAGHTHKQGYFFDRNIHVVSGGCIQQQSKWMRGKRIAAHTGYHIIDMTISEDGVTRFSPTFYPFFV